MKWVMRTGFVRISSSRGDRIYRSLDEIPEPLRDRVRLTLEGPNADTILIADAAAYDRIINSGEELPAELQRFRAPQRIEGRSGKPALDDARAHREWKIVLAVGGGFILSLWALWLWAVQSGT